MGISPIVSFVFGIIQPMGGDPGPRVGCYGTILPVELRSMDSPNLRTGFRVHTTCRSGSVGYVRVVFLVGVWHGLLR